MTEQQNEQKVEVEETVNNNVIENVEEIVEEQPEEYTPYRVFINHVDRYHSKHITAYVADQIYGLSKMLTGGLDEGAAGEDAGEAEPVKSPVPNMPSNKYQFIGTLSGPHRKPTEDIHYIVDETDETFREEILRCGFIIYNITRDSNEISKALETLHILTQELEEIKQIGPKTYENFTETKIFILISTVMTWAFTKPLDPEEPDLPFSEVDYKKRRPHPNYKDHYACEKEVIKTGLKYKDKLKTFVMCMGHTYGEEEDDLEFFFKMAWYNEVLPVFDSGSNKVPFIHIKDLAKALHRLMESAPLKPQFILAVEPTSTTLKQFIKSLSKHLSDGKMKNVTPEEAFLYTDMTQQILERFTVNLLMEPVFLVENLQVEWQSDMNLAENMNQIVNEFKIARKLTPVKIVLQGPPGCGKTKLAQKLCEHYSGKYISTATMLDDYLNTWKEGMNKPEKLKLEETENLGEEEEEEVEEEEDPGQLLESIREAEILMEGGIEKIPDDYIIGLLKMYLGKNFCQNRGYVLDDYPRFIEQAKELFGSTQISGEGEGGGGEEEEEEGGGEATGESNKTFPDLVVGLIATDEYICQQIMKLSEEEIKDTPYAENNILQRLELFRQMDTEDNTVLNYFDELEIDILLIDVESDDLEEQFKLIIQKMGPPPGFGLTEEEEMELYRIEREEKRMAVELELINAQKLYEQAEEMRKNKMEGWAETFEKLQYEEEKILIAQTEPLRHYLMKYVFPTLTRGLIEVARIKPDDPVDFLAEYLFKENPEGKMFDASYNVEGEDLYTDFKNYIETIINDVDTVEK